MEAARGCLLLHRNTCQDGANWVGASGVGRNHAIAGFPSIDRPMLCVNAPHLGRIEPCLARIRPKSTDSKPRSVQVAPTLVAMGRIRLDSGKRCPNPSDIGPNSVESKRTSVYIEPHGPHRGRIPPKSTQFGQARADFRPISAKCPKWGIAQNWPRNRLNLVEIAPDLFEIAKIRPKSPELVRIRSNIGQSRPKMVVAAVFGRVRGKFWPMHSFFDRSKFVSQNPGSTFDRSTL